MEASVAGFGLNPIQSFSAVSPRRVLDKILEPCNAVTVSVYSVLVPIDRKANSPAFP